ncbi:MAG TPA: UDP-N-acetylmuramoyl-tripeptide--D-alanyl-D-alanine ligase [Puia sp.]|nr:UDP-N-acetylmuramoyl-tripeptide--D-alanyl-D-alanine ligase [Puia sp.]
MNIDQLYEVYLRHPSIQTDTRKLKDGDLFFALKGPNFNGNQFALSALERGAAYAIIDEAPPAAGQGLAAGHSGAGLFAERLILVEDVLATLQDLALHHRRQLDIPFIAITGSNGKTTTKELIHAVLSSTFTTYTTVGNLNNHIGVPLTILSVKKDAQFAVIEMGANHQKEIEGYCQYTLPTHGIITNVGKAHLEGFGGPEGVKKGKGELYTFLRLHDGTAFVMWDYDYLREMSEGIPHIFRYGTRDADLTGVAEQGAGQTGNHGREAGQTGNPGVEGSFLRVRITGGAAIGLLSTQLVGDYNLPNVLVAVALGHYFGVPDQRIRQAIEAYTPSNSRSQLIHRDGNHIILDAYNANPSSMKAAIENFARLNTAPGPVDGSVLLPAGSGLPPAGSGVPKKVLVLGAMAELGEESLEEHRQIVELIGRYPWQQVVLVGGDFLRTPHPYRSFANSREAGDWLRQAGLTDTWLLIKGSRSTKMEEVLG